MRAADQAGSLYLVSTPIGNLGDMSHRALDVLSSVDWIAAEDTRHTRQLLQHFAINKRLVPVHDHNEVAQLGVIEQSLRSGESVALVSDAGTPLISDPGYPTVRGLREQGYKVVPVPGPCALVTALSASGMPCDRFVFEGFLPAKPSARRARLERFSSENRTVVFYESTHRIRDCLGDFEAVFGADRALCLARELTKTFETFLMGTVGEVQKRLLDDSDQCRGEFVLMLGGVPEVSSQVRETVTLEVDDLLVSLLPDVPVKTLAARVAKLTGLPKNELYRRALSLKESE